MSGVRDLIEQKRADVRRLNDEIRDARARVDKLIARREKLQADIAELEEYLTWKASR